jgi:hypothetical protein
MTLVLLEDIIIQQRTSHCSLGRLVTREPGEKEGQLCFFYRMLQVHHRTSIEIAGPVLPPMICCAELIIIVAAYSIIMHADNKAVTIVSAMCVGLVATILLVFALMYAIESIEISQKYIEVVKHVQSTKVMTPAEVKIFRSLYPLDWKIGYGGNGFKLTKESIPTIFQDIIVGNLINLIVTTENR